MLRIECTQKEGVAYPLLADQVYTVGRRQGDIQLPDDQSVSRLHAQLEVQHPAGNITEPHLIPVLSLTDSGSKFGTFASEVSIRDKLQISPRESITLPVGEKFRFGLQWNEFRVAYTPFVVTTSSLKPSADLKAKIVKLAGHLVGEWDGNVTHVIMEGVTLTVKVTCALLSAKPIVTPAYVADLLESFKTKKPQPDIRNYLPPVKEKEIATLKESTFYPNPARTTLFGGKIFLFCTAKHLKKLSAAIVAGGGTAEVITQDAESEANVANKEYIIMGQPAEIAIGERDPKAKNIIGSYRRAGKRFIGDSEIGLAAVHNSLDKFCNPKFNMASAVLPTLTTQTQNASLSSITVVPATQEVTSQLASDRNDTSRRVVNETIVKNEAEESDDDVIITSCSIAARGTKRQLEPTTSSGKKRSAVESLTGPDSKRLKDVQSKSPQSPLARSTRSQTRNTSSSPSPTIRSPAKNSSHALTSLFNLSDSDDDENNAVATTTTPIVLETQPEDHDDAPVDDDPQVIQDSQPEESSEPLVSVVDVRNLQSLRTTQGSVTSNSVRRDAVEVENEDDVMTVPDSPPDTVEAESLETDRSQRATRRNLGTDFIDTVTTSIMNAKTIVISKSTPKKTGDNEPSTSRKDSTRKRRREQEDDKALSDRTKKMNLSDLKEIVKGEEAGVVPVYKQSLVNKNFMNNGLKSIIVSSKDTTNGGGPSSKNFKTFKKVLPKFMTARRGLSGQENASGRSVSSILNSSIESIRNTKLVALIPKDYDPGHPKYYGYEDSRPPPINETRIRGEDPDTPDDFRALDSLLNIDPPPPALTRRNTRRNNDEPTASTSANNKRTVAPAPPSSVEDSDPANSRQRRTSPRKKGASQNEASLMPPPQVPRKAPVAPIFVPMELEDDEDEEDDMWAFNN